MYSSLREFIDKLKSENEIATVSAPVDPLLEIAEITDRMAKSAGGGKALLFENTGTAFPVLTNMMGSERRICMALGADSLDQLPLRIDALLGKFLSPKNSLMDKLALLPVAAKASRWFARHSRGRGVCQQVIYQGDQADLGILPVLKCWPFDAGRFITLPLVHTEDPETGARNVGMYRMQITGPRTTGMHWHLHKTGQRHYEAYRKLGKLMPVSVCLGGDPVYSYAATAPLPEGIDEYLLAGFLRGKPVRLVKCLTNNLWVPADCDFVIEGYVDPAEEKFSEGPFGDHTGFYSLEDEYPRFHVTAITHRHDAVYPATIVGIPPHEDLYLARATEKIFLSPIRAALQPEVEDMHMPSCGTAHNLAIVSIHQQYPGQAFKTASSLWGAGQMMFNKFMLIVPSGTDVRNPRAIAPLLRNADISRDLLLSRGVLDVLDHSTANCGTGGKAAIDLTTSRPEQTLKTPEDFLLERWIDRLDFSHIDQWGALIMYCNPATELQIKKFIADNPVYGLNYLIVTDTAAQVLESEELLWFLLANTEPSRDMELHGELLVIDARTKYPYRKGYPLRVPNVVTSSPHTIMGVDLRWDQYRLGPELCSPSAKYGALVMGNGAQIDEDS